MPKNHLLQQLRQGKILLGLCNMYPAAGIIEGMCEGWDFVWIDAQHGQHPYDTALAALRAAAVVGVDTIIRVPGHEYGILGPYADLAPSAIMVPMVNTAQQATAVVNALRFPPRGLRSYGGRRVIDLHGRDYYRQTELAVIAQIETAEAVNHVDAISATDGIDVLFFGPDDMKVSLGISINTTPDQDDQLADAMRRTADAARAAGKFSACTAPNEAIARMAIDMGYQILVGGSDIAYLRVMATQKLADLRALIGKTESEPAAATKGPHGVYDG